MAKSKSLVGQYIGKYKIVENLGRGGMAEVYKAYQENLDRHVAIKLMHSFLADEEDFLTRFQREARAMASLSHANIVGVFDFDVEDDTYYIVMEFVAGGTLKNLLTQLAKRSERLPLAQTIQVVLEIADALAYAHNRGMIHRDIKPANIMLNEDGRAVLTDFGIAKILSGPSFTATGAMIGTPAYMSPEQGLGQAGDARSDLYALGVLFFQMATGRLPYDADTPLAVILKHVNEEIPELTELNPDLPEPIREVILKSMAKEPDERYQTAAEMARDLRTAVQNLDLDLVAALPMELLQEKPTPLPLTTNAGPPPPPMPPKPAPAAAPVAKAPPAKAPVTEAPAPAAVTPAASAGKSGGNRGLLIGGAVVILLVIIALGVILLGGGDEDDGVAAVQATATPADTATPLATADIGATADAAVAATIAAVPTNTAPPEATAAPTATPMPTPDMTLTALASCVNDVRLVTSFAEDAQVNAAIVGSSFTMNWTLQNIGTCPFPAGLSWVNVDGEALGFTEPIPVEAADLATGGEFSLTGTLTAPETAGTYSSVWRLVDAAGEPYGPAITFEVTVVEEATPTPEVTDTPVPPTPPANVEALTFVWTVGNCSLLAADWTCELYIQPAGGIGPYTVLIFDADPPTQGTVQQGGQLTHLITRPRCISWVHDVEVVDSLGTRERRDVFIDPNAYVPGGCS